MASGIKQPKSILTGQLSILPLAERSIREQVESYLSRMRYTLPFPVSTRACYFGCMPRAVMDWDKEGIFGHGPLPSRAGNLLLTMHQSSDRTSNHNRLRNIVHISAEDPGAYYQAMQGGRGFEKMFWIETKPEHPTPRNSSANPFHLPTDHPAYAEIVKWVDAAHAIDDEIEETAKLMELFQTVVQTANVGAKVWPELVNFINFKKGAANNVSRAVKERALEAVPNTNRERILYQLSRAVMLPERSGPLQAWVKFYSHEVAK